MLSFFEEFKVMLHTYPFDIICLTETWMTDNKHLLAYITIPGYAMSYHNRTEKRGGGVGVYLKENTVAKFKVRKDIVALEPSLEHLWLELEGKNKSQ